MNTRSGIEPRPSPDNNNCTNASSSTHVQAKHQSLIVIGSGPVGIRAARMLAGQNPSHRVTVFGEEPHAPYNRVQLSLYLSGEVGRDSINIGERSETSTNTQEQWVNSRIVEIDRRQKRVVDENHKSWPYDILVIATGSTAVVPDIPGIDLENVLRFRTLADTESLLERKEQSHGVFVIGSGPLGIEAALGMKTRENRVFLQARNYLLDPSLDKRAQEILADSLETAGVHVLQGDPITHIKGQDGKVIGVQLESGKLIECDTVVYCTGVTPNTGLAKDAGLETARGILVNDVMQTSDPAIYAVGECAEHGGQTYGVVAPGFEQVSPMSTHVSGFAMPYKGSPGNIQLKFGSQPSALIGDVNNPHARSYVYANRLKGIYRKLFVINQRLIGYIHIGRWDELPSLQEFLTTEQKIKTRSLLQFDKSGNLWRDSAQKHVKDQPDDYIVCLCESVTRGTLTSAMEGGNRTMESLCGATKAGVTCGSCKPLLAQLLDAPAPNLVMRHYKPIYWFSVVAIVLMAMTVLFKPIGIGESAQVTWQLEKLWFDNFWKQVSGYTLLALSLLAAGLSIRKRWKKLNVGHLDDWRYVHSIIGVIALAVLMIHTGLRMGNNLNFVLMAVFLAATLTGSLVGVFMARNHHWTDLKLRQHRTWWSRVHYTLLWMLPALLGYHIFAVYYF
ncbi:FAD-dependent oxidoreductase [Simiduia agarivorans]|uniref:FAD-dependent oxidoreductase n=1 Tax=Simiduia agarivorans TaxID=447471 RepID=UPI0009DBE058|nr:FAD-dependent oxidoreductase [Simiduia agarivorans]